MHRDDSTGGQRGQKECFMCTKRVPSMYENKKNAYNLELSDNSRIFALVETN